MLPISELHFAFCGIATVAATLGYACARRAALSLTPPNESSKADVEAGPPEERSLKRKLDDSEEYDVDAEEQPRPMKRNRTPPSHKRESEADFLQEWEVIVAPPPYEEAVGIRRAEKLVQDSSTAPEGNPPSIEQHATMAREPTPPAHPEPLPQSEEKGVEAGCCTAPQPQHINAFPNEPEAPARPVTPPKPTAPSKAERSNAFSAFSGSSSPFASYSNTSGASPFGLPGQTVRTTPAWRRGSENESDVFSRAVATNALAPSPNDAVTTTTSSTSSQSKGALTATRDAQSSSKTSSYVTGEEDEYVEAELKGVKLFVKRGRKEFTDGMYGHVKILTQKSVPQKSSNEDSQATEAETSSRTRLLFRRDPLGQVSMNVGLRPTVRCHFDPTENILRVILMEQVTTDGETAKEDIVVYAVKPGRAQKADFQSFAKTFCDHEGLKSRTVTSSTDTAGSNTAAP